MNRLKMIAFGYTIYSAFLVSAPGPSCAHVAQPAEGCARQVTADLLEKVTAGLIPDNFEDLLKDIGASVGECALTAAVQRAESIAAADSAGLAAHDPRTTAIVAHAQAWLAAHGGPPVFTVKAGAPGGGPGFCCIRADGHRWTIGDTDPVTGQVMTTQAMVNGACGSGHLPIRRAC